MAERFQVINKNTSVSILKGCPVIIEAYSLLKDNKTDTAVAQIKMRNLAEKRVIAVKVNIETFEINGTKVTGIDAFSFLDIRIMQGESFGDRKPITLPNNTTRIIKPCIIEVVFEDNTVWKHEAVEWETLKTADPFPLEATELQKQYEIETKSKCKNYPMVEQGFFVCSCGNINIEGNACFRCGAVFEDLITPLLDPDALKTRAEARVVKEEYDSCCVKQEMALSAEELRSLQKRFEKLGDYKDSTRRKVECEEKATQLEEEARQLEEKRQKEIERKILEEKARDAKRKKRRPFIIIFSILSVVGIIIAGTYLYKVSKFNKAIDLMDSRRYEEAKAEFEALGSFSNAEEKVVECTYQNAKALMNEKKYDVAISMLSQISSYKDASKLIDDCNEGIKQVEKEKEEAAEAARQAAQEAEKAKWQQVYESAASLLRKGKRDDAYQTLYKAFKDNGYSDASTLAWETYYDILILPYKNSEPVYLSALLTELQKISVDVSDLSAVKTEIGNLLKEIARTYQGPQNPNNSKYEQYLYLEIGSDDSFNFCIGNNKPSATGYITWVVSNGKIVSGISDGKGTTQYIFTVQTDGINVSNNGSLIFKGLFKKDWSY